MHTNTKFDGDFLSLENLKKNETEYEGVPK